MAKCTNCDEAKISLNFGEAIYSKFREQRYGIETGCSDTSELDIYNKEVFDLMKLIDAEYTATEVVDYGPQYLLTQSGNRFIV
jgi:hypothetical protein